ncbi:hypothetical protein [uncultured Lacinutrix sp.]|uniref:hypothetical protein n=1 Tax=uncultured Lacinutrix sp. TaxID=574032 RepID=UPI00262A0680|nr:hypothetical protein [uncultured Lacinutrix sp.]
MFTNRQSLFLSGVVVIGFFLSGLLGILDYFITKLVLASLFLLVIFNLFMTKKDISSETDDANPDDKEEM